jgi:hypothetical protein
MDFNDSEKIVEEGEKHPKRTLIIFLVLLMLIAVFAYATGFFGEKGKRHAIPSNERAVTSVPSSKVIEHQKEDINAPVINQHTEGNQSPALQVAPGGTATFNYSSSKEGTAKE